MPTIIKAVALIMSCGPTLFAGAVAAHEAAPGWAAQEAFASRAEAPVQGYEVVRTYPHDTGAFTQGLLFHDGHLYESTGRYPSTVRRVRLEDGVVLQIAELPCRCFGEGLAVWEDSLVSLTWRSRGGFIWDRAALTPIAVFGYEGEGWGLTADDRRLIMSDGTSELRFLDPETLAETSRLTVTDGGRQVESLNELEWIDGEIYANVWQSERIARIDPETGHVISWIDLSGLLESGAVADPEDEVLNGIAWDAQGRRLFVTGKHWPSVFEIRLAPR